MIIFNSHINIFNISDITDLSVHIHDYLPNQWNANIRKL